MPLYVPNRGGFSKPAGRGVSSIDQDRGLCVRPLCHYRLELGSGSGFSGGGGSDPMGPGKVILTVFLTSERLIADESGDLL